MCCNPASSSSYMCAADTTEKPVVCCKEKPFRENFGSAGNPMWRVDSDACTLPDRGDCASGCPRLSNSLSFSRHSAYSPPIQRRICMSRYVYSVRSSTAECRSDGLTATQCTAVNGDVVTVESFEGWACPETDSDDELGAAERILAGTVSVMRYMCIPLYRRIYHQLDGRNSCQFHCIIRYIFSGAGVLLPLICAYSTQLLCS